MAAKKKKKEEVVVQARPKGVVGSLFWMATYHTWKLVGIIFSIALSAFLIFCFNFNCDGDNFKAGAKPIDTKLNINK